MLEDIVQERDGTRQTFPFRSKLEDYSLDILIGIMDVEIDPASRMG